MRVNIQFYIDPGGTPAQSVAQVAGPDWKPTDSLAVI